MPATGALAGGDAGDRSPSCSPRLSQPPRRLPTARKWDRGTGHQACPSRGRGWAAPQQGGIVAWLGRGRKAGGAAGTSHLPRAQREEGQMRPAQCPRHRAVLAAARTQASLTIQETLDCGLDLQGGERPGQQSGCCVPTALRGSRRTHNSHPWAQQWAGACGVHSASLETLFRGQGGPRDASRPSSKHPGQGHVQDAPPGQNGTQLLGPLSATVAHQAQALGGVRGSCTHRPSYPGAQNTQHRQEQLPANSHRGRKPRGWTGMSDGPRPCPQGPRRAGRVCRAAVPGHGLRGSHPTAHLPEHPYLSGHGSLWPQQVTLQAPEGSPRPDPEPPCAKTPTLQTALWGSPLAPSTHTEVPSPTSWGGALGGGGAGVGARILGR